MIKRAIAILITVTMVLGIAGCTTSPQEAPAATQGAASTAEPTSAIETTPSPEPETMLGIIPVTELPEYTFSAEQNEKALKMPPASNTALPDWHGASLTSLCYFYHEPEEADVADMDNLGFDFARVPLAIPNIYPNKPDMTTIDADKIRDIDRVVNWGIEHGVHICLDLHDTPGSSAMEPWYYENELYDNETYRNIVVQFWAMLAERYKDVPNNALSFNLINEPAASLSDETYSALMREVIEAIRAYTPERLIFVDMRGLEPTMGVVDLGVAQSFHYYKPHSLTHIAFVHVLQNNSPEPGFEMPWPYPMVYNNIYENPFTVLGEFHAGETIELSVERVDVASPGAEIKLDADGVNIFTQAFSPAVVGENGCTEIENEGTEGATGVYDVKYTVTLPNDCEKLTLYEAGSCHWFSIHYITVPNAGSRIMLSGQWFEGDTPDNPQTVIQIHPDGSMTNENGLAAYAFSEESMTKDIAKLKQFSEDNGVAIMLQEFAVHYQTPYSAATAYMNSLLNVTCRAGIPWCAWDFSDEFGFITDDDLYRRDGAEYVTLHDSRAYDKGIMEILTAHMG